MASKHTTAPTPTKTMAALTAMLAFSVCPTQAFQATFLAPRTRLVQVHRNPWSSGAVRPATMVTMDTAPSWDTDGDMLQRQPQGQHRRPAVFAPPDWYQGAHIQKLQVSDPAVVQDTDDHYTLSFSLPPEVDHDGLQVSVSGRLLTVKARITHEDDLGPSTSGWITRSSRTESVSRSFILPEGVVASSASTSYGADGKVEVKFDKNKAAAGGTTPTATAPTASSARNSADTPTATAGAPASPADPAGDPSKTTPPANTAAPLAAPSKPSHPESAFEALDKEFRDFAEALWGDFMLPRLEVPTQEEREKQAAEAREWRAKREEALAARAKAAKEAREKRVMAMRRATMAADISVAEDGSSYLVKFALPEGMTRYNVHLTVSPDRSLRVTVSTPASDGSPAASVYKDVRLPKDAILSDISARFIPEHQDEHLGDRKKGDAGKAERASDDVGAAGMVSGLEVTVGKEAPPRPKSIDIE